MSLGYPNPPVALYYFPVVGSRQSLWVLMQLVDGDSRRERRISLPWVGSTDQTQLASATATRDVSYETGQFSLASGVTSLKLPASSRSEGLDLGC
jgi:hypothetical protein